MKTVKEILDFIEEETASVRENLGDAGGHNSAMTSAYMGQIEAFNMIKEFAEESLDTAPLSS